MYYHLFQVLQACTAGNPEGTAEFKETIPENKNGEYGVEKNGDTFYGVSYRWDWEALRI